MKTFGFILWIEEKLIGRNKPKIVFGVVYERTKEDAETFLIKKYKTLGKDTGFKIIKISIVDLHNKFNEPYSKEMGIYDVNNKRTVFYGIQ